MRSEGIFINILTIFPEQVKSYISVGILNRASDKGLIIFNIIDIRDFSLNKHRKVDDIPYGGGPGMVMGVDAVVGAIESIKEPGIKILLSPKGELFSQKTAISLTGKNITLICGRYTGIDFRIKKFIDKIISVGNFIVSGGEIPALMITEAVTRLVPGALGNKLSLSEDKGYPIYTRPYVFRGLKVPDVLLSGNHKKIEEFRNREHGNDKINRKTIKK